MTGGVAIKDSKMTLDNLKLTLDEVEGTMALSGVYNTQNPKKPTVDFDADIANFDIPKTVKMFNTVEKLAPIAKYSTGKFGTKLKFTACPPAKAGGNSCPPLPEKKNRSLV